ncbi:MAG: PTS sugar transporter subunit IIB [Firmicutes bacterium]|nr:PTS sugar transporter subunit IIB [Bacillota bacterium]
MAKKVRILIACGTGVATSTLCAERVKEICSDRGFEIEVTQCTLGEIPNLSSQVDIIVTTSKYNNKSLGKPIISGTSFITGVNEEKAIIELTDTISKII